MKTLNFGKHKGEKLVVCPVSYLKWLASHLKRLAERNRWASRLARKLLEEKEMSYQVGQVVKNLQASHGPAVCIATITKIEDEKIFATLPEGGTYEYTAEDFVLATEQDIADAKRWHERNVSMNHEMLHSKLPAIGHDYPWDMFDEDGVRIA